MGGSQSLDLNMNPADEDPLLLVINIPSNLMESLHEQWQDYLIVKLLGKKIGYDTLNAKVKIFGICWVTMR